MVPEERNVVPFKTIIYAVLSSFVVERTGPDFFLNSSGTLKHNQYLCTQDNTGLRHHSTYYSQSNKCCRAFEADRRALRLRY